MSIARPADKIPKRNLIRLSPRDARKFVNLLLEPPSPTPHLRRAAKRYMAAVTRGALSTSD